MTQKKIDPFHCITLTEGDRVNGAWVRIPSNDPRVPVGTVISRYFGYEAFKGAAPAIAAAKEWRDQTGVEVWGELWPHGVATLFKPRIRRAKNNTSGEIGVHLSKGVKNGHEFRYWVAMWQTGPPSDRRTARKQFSVIRYGFDAAKKLAIQSRKKGVEDDLLSR